MFHPHARFNLPFTGSPAHVIHGHDSKGIKRVSDAGRPFFSGLVSGGRPGAGSAPALTRPSAERAAIETAARESGVEFGHLLRVASAESGLDAKARNRASTATGLFQFIDRTWLDLVRRHGSELGLAAEASHIRDTAHGPVVRDSRTRAAILELRKDPAIASAAAAIFTRENAGHLSRQGANVSGGALYAAHLLGAGGAARILAAAEENPHQRAASLLPAAARGNRALFYEEGRALTVREFVDRLEARFGTEAVGGLDGDATGDSANAAPPRLRETLEFSASEAFVVDNRLDIRATQSLAPTLALLLLQDVSRGAIDRLGAPPEEALDGSAGVIPGRPAGLDQG